MSDTTERNELFIDFAADGANTPAVEPQYLTDEGVPMLFDVAVPGERVRREQIRLQPAAPEDASDALRNELLAEIQKNLETGHRNDD